MQTKHPSLISPKGRRLLVIVMLLLPFGKAGMGYAQTPYVAIPDSNFVHYLKTIVPTAFKGDSLNTSSPLVTTTTHTINVNGLGIVNLSGVQYFTSLTDLSCGTNSLTSLPSLPNSVTVLDCISNSLTNLPTLPNSLNSLYCDDNYLTSISALPNSLTILYCENNSLTSLPSLPDSLIILYCATNSLSNLPSLPNSLAYIDCSNNSLTSLPALPNTLVNFDCGGNAIACFPTFPNSIANPSSFSIDPNPYNCLPNYIAAMSATDLAKPLCAAGNTNGCAVAGIQQVSGINNQVTVYPNPAKGIINVNGPTINEETHIQLIDMFGNFVAEYTTSDKTKNIDVSSLQEGVYNLSITTKEGVINKRVVIEK
jgi:type IX secretion system substrate protein